MFLETAAQYLQDQKIGKMSADGVTIGPEEFTIYIGSQGEADNCITLLPTGGFNPDLTFSGPGLEEPTFQVLARGKSFGATWSAAYNTYKLLHGSSIFSYIAAQQSPAGLGKDENGRHEFSCNFKIIKIFD